MITNDLLQKFESLETSIGVKYSCVLLMKELLLVLLLQECHCDIVIKDYE